MTTLTAFYIFQTLTYFNRFKQFQYWPFDCLSEDDTKKQFYLKKDTTQKVVQTQRGLRKMSNGALLAHTSRGGDGGRSPWWWSPSWASSGSCCPASSCQSPLRQPFLQRKEQLCCLLPNKNLHLIQKGEKSIGITKELSWGSKFICAEESFSRFKFIKLLSQILNVNWPKNESTLFKWLSKHKYLLNKSSITSKPEAFFQNFVQ